MFSLIWKLMIPLNPYFAQAMTAHKILLYLDYKFLKHKLCHDGMCKIWQWSDSQLLNYKTRKIFCMELNWVKNSCQMSTWNYTM